MDGEYPPLWVTESQTESHYVSEKYETHTCEFCQNLQLHCPTEAGFGGATLIQVNATARDVINDSNAEPCCELIQLLRSFWKVNHSSREPRRGDIQEDVMFSVTGNDKIPDEVYSRPSEFDLVFFTRSSGSRWSRHDFEKIIGFGFNDRSTLDCYIWWFFDINLAVFTGYDDPASNCISTRPINRHPNSVETYNLARSWLSSCLDSHSIEWCQAPSGRFAPKRLLEIRPHLGGSVFAVRLVEPEEWVPYAAFSYCWGGDQPHKTTRSKLDNYRKNIGWYTIPRSIQDAITVAYRLGLQRLWVDSYCVIQDDLADTAKEIAKMPQIYEESTVSIVASRSSKSTEGFLDEVPPQAISSFTFKLSLQCSESFSGSIYLMLVQNNAFDSVIETRGWTLQEWYLAPRRINYDLTQVSWHCALPSHKLELPPTNGWRLDPRFVGPAIYDEARDYIEWPYISPPAPPPGYDMAAFVVELWWRIVESYTKRNLTKPEDRILAISGIAKRCFDMSNDRYLAGLWRRSIDTDLLWTCDRVDRPPLDAADASVYQGPSWSWVGCIGSVKMYKTPGTSRIDFLDANVSLVEPTAPYGAVTTGQLRLRGRLRPAKWDGDKKLFYWNDGPALRFDVIPDSSAVNTRLQDPDANVDARLLCHFDVYLLLLRSDHRFSEKKNSTLLEHAGLILVSTEPDGTENRLQKTIPRLKRVGHFSSMKTELSMADVQWPGPEVQGLETHAVFDNCIEQVLELE